MQHKQALDRSFVSPEAPIIPIARPAPAQRAAAMHLVEALVHAGVDTFFGVPGGPVSPVFDAVLNTAGARLVESRHETNAAFAAIGFHRSTGRVPTVLVTAGPGATNVITGIACAHAERVPMLVICGDVAWAASGGKLLQDSGPAGVGIEAMVRHLTRATATCEQPRSAAAQVLALLGAAADPRRPGPALLVLPIDRGLRETPAMRLERAREARRSDVPAGVIADTAAWLRSAQHPLVVLGAGCRDQVGQVLALVEALGVPFMTTPQAKGILSEEHPLSLRHGGLAASWWARRYTAAGVDVALVLGTDLDDCAVGPTPPVGPGGRLVHVDLDAHVFNRNYPTALGVIADLGAFADALREAVTAHPRREHASALAALREARAGSPFDRPDFAADDAVEITPHRAIADLARAAGPTARFVTDIGEHMLFALHYLTARDPGAFAIHLGLGSMGSGIGSAIGLALGDPTRRVVCVCGDGGMQMAGGELLVAIKERLPIVYAVFNDARYNMVYHGFRQVYGRGGEYSTSWIDFVGWAAALGVRGARVERPGEITPELLDELTADGMPAVLDIRIDRSVRLAGAGRNEALKQMSMPGSEGSKP